MTPETALSKHTQRLIESFERDIEERDLRIRALERQCQLLAARVDELEGRATNQWLRDRTEVVR